MKKKPLKGKFGSKKISTKKSAAEKKALKLKRKALSKKVALAKKEGQKAKHLKKVAKAGKPKPKRLKKVKSITLPDGMTVASDATVKEGMIQGEALPSNNDSGLDQNQQGEQDLNATI
jgi:hypothetical protein